MAWPHRNKPHSNTSASCPSCDEKLKSAHPDLKEWFRTHIKKNWHNVHISWTFRGKSAQEKAFAEGKTTLHFPDSPHNKTPSLAIDLFQIDENGVGVWDTAFFARLNQYNIENGIILGWGGDFRDLKDYCHFELQHTAKHGDKDETSS